MPARAWLIVAALTLAGCAALQEVDSTVATYGGWSAERHPGSFVFERLPSEQTQPQYRQMLEDAARAALASAGFLESADPLQAEYLLQIGARVTTNDPWLYNEPLFWPIGARYGRLYGYPYGYARWGRPWGAGGWYTGPIEPQFEREVALLIRERRTGELLYEARATNLGPSPAIERQLPAMYQAALAGFPAVEPAPHPVRVILGPPP